MIGYVTLGTNDIQRAAAFYDALLAEFGASRFIETDSMVIWGIDPKRPMLSVTLPYDGQTATAGNGTMVAMGARDPEFVQRVHQKALSLGAVNEGDPGMRTEQFHGAYFRDPDGNKLAVFCIIDSSPGGGTAA